MRLYIIRHAETEYNRKGIIQGSEVDSDINDKGDIQAKLFYEYYKDINFDKIYVSALKRTFQTIRRFSDNGIPYEKIKEFNEISWGINQGKSDDLEDYSKLINTWLSGNLDNKFENGESPKQLSKEFVRGHYLETGHHSELYAAREAGTEEPPIPALPQSIIDQTSNLYADMYERLTGQQF